ncbi:MAG: carboxypeptidase-like regulatory domain-containing protein, partial [Bacteroidetes bacterium]|nr:carboxypeptidase-like regulatory domain-containing protein [Bacteroidota bacterium]
MRKHINYVLWMFLFVIPFGVFAQTNYTGKVIEGASGNPLAGATIQISGTNLTTFSGGDGSFSIQSPNSNASLLISYVGFIPQTIK